MSRRLAEVLEAYRGRGEIVIAHCGRAGDLFVGMIRGNQHLRVVLGLRPPPVPEGIEASLETAVEIFLDGVRVHRRG